MAEQRLGRDVMSAPLPELAGVPRAALRPDRRVRRDRAYRRRPGSAGVDRVALKPGGKLVMTVPAHQWMWSAHDVVNHHKRRYSKRALKRLIESSPLRLEAIGYFNSLLFPLAVAERLSSKVRARTKPI